MDATITDEPNLLSDKGIRPKRAKLTSEDYRRLNVMFKKGLSLAEIAQQEGVSLGALRRYAYLHGWTTRLEKKSKTAVIQAKSSASEGGRNWQNRIISLALRYLGKLENQKDEELAALEMPKFKQQIEVFQQLDQVGRRQFGLDLTNNGLGTLHVSVVTEPSAPQQGQLAPAIVDAELVPQPQQPASPPV
jgi:hypothetical protein